MQIPRVPHRWAVTPRQAVAIQRRLAARVELLALAVSPRWVAGVDCAFSADGGRCAAAVVLWDMAEQRVVEQVWAAKPLRFPYIPGFLSFREAPAILAALRRLRQMPEVILCDGQGLAHPRRFGIACHLGVILGLPTLGCAKSRLVGEHEEPPLSRGSRAPLFFQGEIVGSVLRTQDGIKPVYVSIGHKLDLPTAEQLVLMGALKYRLPEPTRLADQYVARVKNLHRHDRQGYSASSAPSRDSGTQSS